MYIKDRFYKFESKSQHGIHCPSFTFSVYQRSFLQVWKQITTVVNRRFFVSGVYIKDRFYKFESKSQLTLRASIIQQSVYQRSFLQVWKQITTSRWARQEFRLVYIKDRFYKFESKSQQYGKLLAAVGECISKIVFTSLKANHNYSPIAWIIEASVYQRSFLQVWKQITTLPTSHHHPMQCISKIVFTSLKANHNITRFSNFSHSSVYQRSFLQVWKQITTWFS